jgi:coatomer protein complex subunit alpha (xenin)
LSLGACLLLEIGLNQKLKFCTDFCAQTIFKRSLVIMNLEDLEYTRTSNVLSFFAGEDEEEEGWEMEDLELPAELAVADVVPTGSTYFAVPPPGIPTSQIWVQTSSLAGEHAAAGAFDTAMRLLNRQLGIKNFEPLKSVFLELHLASHTSLPTMVSLPVLPLALLRGWSETASPNTRGLPALIYKLSSLEETLRVAYKTTTEGKFTEALRYVPMNDFN